MKFLFTIDVERDPLPTPTPSFRGVAEGMPRLLDCLRESRVAATMFVSGEVAGRFPKLVKEIALEGHEIGSHGHDHSLGYLTRHGPQVMRSDIARGREAIETATGTRPRCFRAPNFGVDARVVRELGNAGFSVDSSVLPGRLVRKWRLVKLVDHRGAPTSPYHPSFHDHRIPGAGGVLEVPVTPNPESPGGPIGLGFLNARGIEATIRGINQAFGDYVMFLSHAWEAVDLTSQYLGSAHWLRDACSSSMDKLRSLLQHVGRRFEVTTVEALAFGQRG